MQDLDEKTQINMKKIFDESTAEEFTSDGESDGELLPAKVSAVTLASSEPDCVKLIRDAIEEEFDADENGQHTSMLRNKIIK